MNPLDFRRPTASSQAGQGTSEYALLLGLVAMVVIVLLVLVGRSTQSTYDAVATAIAMGPGGTAEVTPDLESTEESTPEPTLEPTPTTTATPEVTPEITPETTEDAPTSPPASGGGGSPAATPTDEPTPEPTAQPLNRYYDYFDGNGNIPWSNATGSWGITSQYFTSAQNYSKVIGNIPLSNYEFASDVQTLRSLGSQTYEVTMVLFRVQNASTFYAVMLRKDGVIELAKSTSGQWQGWLSVTATHLDPFALHEFRIKVIDDHIQVFIDNHKYVDYRDSSPILSGGIGYSNNNSYGTVDNVEVARRAN